MRPKKTIADYQAELDALDRTIDELVEEQNARRAKLAELTPRLTAAEIKADNTKIVAFEYDKPERKQAAEEAAHDLAELQDEITETKKAFASSARQHALANVHHRQLERALARARKDADKLAEARLLVQAADEAVNRRLDQARELVEQHDGPEAA